MVKKNLKSAFRYNTLIFSAALAGTLPGCSGSSASDAAIPAVQAQSAQPGQPETIGEEAASEVEVSTEPAGAAGERAVKPATRGRLRKRRKSARRRKLSSRDIARQIQEIVTLAEEAPEASAAEKGAPGEWMESPVRIVDLPGGGSQSTSRAIRIYPNKLDQRVIDDRTQFTFKERGQRGTHVLFKTRIYKKADIVTFHKKFESEVFSGRSRFATREHSQLRKNKSGDWTSTLLREYVIGSGTDSPAVRLVVTSQPWLLSQTFKLNLYSRDKTGIWQKISSVSDEKWETCFSEAEKGLPKIASDASRLLAALVLGLWQEALSEEASDVVSSFLVPFVTYGGHRHLSEVGVDQMLARARSVLEQMREKNIEKGGAFGGAGRLTFESDSGLGDILADFEDFNRLAADRAPLHAELQQIILSPQDAKTAAESGIRNDLKNFLDRYEALLEKSLSRKPPPLYSVGESLQDNCVWTLDAFSKVLSLPGASKQEKSVKALPGELKARRASRHASISLRALHIFEMFKEQEIIAEYLKAAQGAAGAESEAGRIKVLQEKIDKSIMDWETELS